MPLLTTFAATSAMSCWMIAARTFNVPPELLFAIAEVESGHRADAVAQAANGTYSVGLMQINSSWFGKLGQYGIDERMLYQPCVNIRVGAWILSQEIARYGPTWEAIGAYYAGPYDERSLQWKLPHYRQYARKVLRAWQRRAERQHMRTQ